MYLDAPLQLSSLSLSSFFFWLCCMARSQATSSHQPNPSFLLTALLHFYYFAINQDQMRVYLFLALLSQKKEDILETSVRNVSGRSQTYIFSKMWTIVLISEGLV